MRQWTLACLTVALVLACGCTTLAEEAPRIGEGPQRTTVRLGRVVRGDITGALTFDGELSSRGQVVVSPRVSGTLARIVPQPGARVNAGDVVAELDRVLLEEQVRRAEAGLRGAEAYRIALQTSSRPEEIAAAQALYNAANARLADIQAASQSPAQALSTLSAAQAHLQELEGVNRVALSNAIQNLDSALNQLNIALGSNPVDAGQVASARESVAQARLDVIASVTPSDPAALAQARDSVAAAQRDLILADLAASPINALEAQAFAEMAYQRLLTISSPANDAQIAAAQAEVDAAAAGLELARQSLRGATLTSPISGVVTERFVSEGSPVGPGVAILEIVPLELSLDFAVPEAALGSTVPGQEIGITVSAYPSDTFSGIVVVTAPAVDPRDRTVHARATVSDPQNKLKSGMFAQVAVTTGAREQALLLPLDAVVTESSGTSTWLVVDGRAKRQSIKLGVRDTQRVEVVDGLFDGAEVILGPPQLLTDGQYVLAQ